MFSKDIPSNKLLSHVLLPHRGDTHILVFRAPDEPAHTLKSEGDIWKQLHPVVEIRADMLEQKVTLTTNTRDNHALNRFAELMPGVNMESDDVLSTQKITFNMQDMNTLVTFLHGQVSLEHMDFMQETQEIIKANSHRSIAGKNTPRTGQVR